MTKIQDIPVRKLLQPNSVNTLGIKKRDGGYIFLTDAFSIHVYENSFEQHTQDRMQVYLESTTKNHIPVPICEMILDFVLETARENKFKGVCFIGEQYKDFQQLLANSGFREIPDPFFLEALQLVGVPLLNTVTDWVLDL